ncbi:serine protease inhibitor 42Dd isoform X8 [Bactrocera dorsalis]|uniref:Serine protease inhibitor 42Dd isoform X8 n=1 Tax=Bactrocera dorsalis TaxID=27457 RepID=A0A6I9UWC1_BACDO|nr:serine protease inhibitor 42Dd isoform X8 [Bactrocera dorsalis]
MLMSFIGRKIVNAKNLLALWNPLSRRGNYCNFGTFLSFVLLLSVYTTTATMSSHDQLVAQREFASKSAQFAVKLFNQMHNKDPNKNIIYSPFSIQTCVGMARIGAVGETAAELDRGLGLPSNDVTAIADTFHSILVTYKDSPILKVANKIYVMQGYSVKKEFNEIATTKFFSSADSINFADSTNAANTINKWVESKTNNLIKDLIAPDAVDSDTRVVLVNAIHFKGEWKYQFPKSATRDDDFYLNEVDSVRVPMMNLKETFGYGVISELDATVLEMPYKDSDLSMVVILPNSRTGLASLQEKLKNFNLSDITRYLMHTKVIVKMPKFKAEYDIQLNDALINLGMARMFSKNAEFSNMLDSDERLQVSKVVHKAFIEVNEEGTEAAAATAIFLGFSGPALPKPPPRKFIADRPFVFLIKNKANFLIFAGQKARR